MTMHRDDTHDPHDVATVFHSLTCTCASCVTLDAFYVDLEGAEG